MNHRFRACVLALLMTLMAPAGVVADAIYRYRVVVPDDDTEATLNVSVNASSIAITGYPGGDLIFRGPEQQLVAVDHRTQSYMIVDMQLAKSLAITVNLAVQQIRRQLEGLPPEQREQVEQNMLRQLGIASGEPARIDVADTGREGKAMGIACHWWEVSKNGEVIRDICIASAADLPDGRQSLQTMMALARLQADIFEQLAEVVPLELPDNPFALLDRIGGIPMISNGLNSLAGEGSATLIGADIAELPADTFRPPADYRRQDILAGGS